MQDCLIIILTILQKVFRRGVFVILVGFRPNFLRRGHFIADVLLVPERRTLSIINVEPEDVWGDWKLVLILVLDKLSLNSFRGLQVIEHADERTGEKREHDEEERDRSARSVIGVKSFLSFVAQRDWQGVQVNQSAHLFVLLHR